MKNVTFELRASAMLLAVLLAACSRDDAAPQATSAPAMPTAPAGATVAVVDGEVLTEPMLAVFAQGRGLDPADPAARQRALDALIENVLLAQDARSSGLAARPEVQAEVALVGIQQLAGRTLSEWRRTQVPTDEQVRAYYDQEAARTGGIELHLEHILFADEAEARAALERALAAGADFTALMGEYAAGSAKQARDLGWANLTQLPPELAAAAQAVADGQVGPQPVQTGFGWHVFRRIESRPFSPPPFEQVQAGARKQLADKMLAERVAALRDKAKIELPTAAK
jgi:peptidyl-prolyl cis-trans isomerase C